MISRISIEAEQAAVGAVLINSEVLDDILDIAGIDDFTSGVHQRILRKAQELRNGTGTADTTTICVELSENPDDVNYAVDIASNTPSTANHKTYARIVREKAKLRAVDSAIIEAGDAANTSETAQEAAEAAQSKLSNLDLSKGEDAVQSAAQAAKSMILLLQERYEAKKRGCLGGLSTGLTDIDNRLDGLRDGALIVAAGRPGMGKSVYGGKLAETAAIRDGKHVLFFSLEMPSEEVIERMAASVGRIPYSQIRDSSCLDNYNQHLTVAIGKIKDSNLKIIDTPSIHINQIKSYTRKVNRKQHVDLVVVDHISIASGDGNNREREMASITGGLKALAKEIKCPVVAL